jgi:hypothetical protein
MAKEIEDKSYAEIFKKGKHIAECQVRGTMAGPDAWQTFKPIEITASASKVPNGKYELFVLEGGKSAPAYFVTIKDYAFTKTEMKDRTAPAAARSVKEVIAERAQKFLKAKRPAAKAIDKEREHER